MKKVINLMLISTLAFGSTSTVFANVDTETMGEKSVIEISENTNNQEVILESYNSNFTESNKTTRSSYLAINETLSSSTGSQSVTFDATKNYPFFRVFINNTSSVKYNAVVAGNSYTILAKSSKTIYTSTAIKKGTYKVSVTSSDGSKLKGNVAVRVAQKLSEVKP